MSKAFTRESDFDDLPAVPPLATVLPPGTKNLMTAAGAERLRADLTGLIEQERPPLAARAADDIDTRRELQLLDQRIRHLRTSLETAEIVESPPGPADVVRFGNTVTVRESDGTEARYRIVGVDEADLDAEAINWQSPLARSLLNARRGSRVAFQAPGGNRELEIIVIE
jgi:transcription elongation factor GreB